MKIPAIASLLVVVSCAGSTPSPDATPHAIDIQGRDTHGRDIQSRITARPRFPRRR